MKLWHWILIGGGALYLLTRPKTAAASGEPRVNLLNQQLVALGGAWVAQKGNTYSFSVTGAGGAEGITEWTDLIDSLAASLEDAGKTALLEVVRPARDWK